MPCEKCNAQFSVFKRKKNCTECMRFYCNQCLVKRNNAALCERCLIFTKRPLFKSDLLNLKPKDLIFYLQAKHISTTGCVEKEELVDLILAHVNYTDNLNDASNCRKGSISSNGTNKPTASSPKSPKEFVTKNQSKSSIDADEQTNTFENIKNSCQSFFNTVTEKIASDFNLIGESTGKKERSGSNTSSTVTNISEQPRVTKREIPPYSKTQQKSNISTQNNRKEKSTGNSPNSPVNNVPISPTSIDSNWRGTNTRSSSTTTSSRSSPINSISSGSSQSTPQQNIQPINIGKNKCENTKSNLQEDGKDNLYKKHSNGEIPEVHKIANKRKLFNNVLTNDNEGNAPGSSSGCECSDDEVILKFRKQKSKEKVSEGSTTTSPTVITNTKMKTSPMKPISLTTKYLAESQTLEDSSSSSFEELNGTTSSGLTSNYTGASSTSDTESWQILNNDTALQSNDQSSIASHSTPTNNTSLVEYNETANIGLEELPAAVRQQRRILRRRSDGYIINQNRAAAAMAEIISPNILITTENSRPQIVEEESENEDDINSEWRKRSKRNCQKCGKSKANLKRRIAKFRKQLESSELSEQDIKEEIKNFLEYLENRTKSIDSSESDNAGAVGGDYNDNMENTINILELTEEELRQRIADEYEETFLNGSDGIHVYANNYDDDYNFSTPLTNGRFDSRFINLQDFKSLDEFENLSVKQLKEILMLNRVDYKGCCEKTELLERVHRLWKNFQECPAIDKLPTDDLCKICMDASIECVLLECGHACTCTNCGKVLNECPICRQYIIRVVRFFKA